MKFLDLKLENSKVMIIQFDPHSSDPDLHDHGDEYQISIPLLGSSMIEMNQAEFHLENKLRLVTAPFEQHRHFTNEHSGRVLLINFKRPFIEKVLIDRLGHLPATVEFVPWAEGSSDSLKKIADRVISMSLSSSMERMELEELELEMAHQLLSLHEGSHTDIWRQQVNLRHHPLIKRALDFIHEHFAEELSLDRVAEISGMSKYHFIRLFHAQVGSTPSQYLNHVRLDFAEQLIQLGHEDITTIAFRVGFGSLTSFERLFKKRHGMNATQYKVLNKKNRVTD